MMKSPPASPLEVSQAEFALQFLIVAFDAPAPLDDVDENRERHVLGQGRKPVFGRLRLALRPFEDKPFDGVGSTSLWSREAGRTRTAAKREDKGWLEPSRHSTSFQASAGKRIARSLAETADDRGRVAGAKACALGRSRASAARALRREARPTASIARLPHRGVPAPSRRRGNPRRSRSRRRSARCPSTPSFTAASSGERDLRPRLELQSSGTCAFLVPRPSPRFQEDRADRRSADSHDDWRSIASPRSDSCPSSRRPEYCRATPTECEPFF